MTLAFGVLAQGGAVIAADRQETSGSFKTSMGKISAHWAHNRGTLVCSGAGDGPYIDTVTAKLVEWFKNAPSVLTESKLGSEIQQRHKDFYSEYVMPFLGHDDIPDYDLLIAFSGVEGNSLWTTHKLAVAREVEFAAVGAGATAAKAMMQRLGYPFLELEIAVPLAAYVVYQVKRTVDYVGLDTDIVEIRNGVPLIIPRHEITEMETHFRDYGDVERDNLYSYFGGDIAKREEFSGTVGRHVRKEESIRKFFKEWGEKRKAQYPLRVQYFTDESKQSASQTPKPGQ